MICTTGIHDFPIQLGRFLLDKSILYNIYTQYIIYKIYKTDFINITSFRGNNNLNIKIYSEAVSVSANKDRIVTQHIIKHTTHTSIYSPTLK